MKSISNITTKLRQSTIDAQSESGHAQVRSRKDGYLGTCDNPAICTVCQQELPDKPLSLAEHQVLREALRDSVEVVHEGDIQVDLPLPKPWDLQHDDDGIAQVLFTAKQTRQYAKDYANAKAAAERERTQRQFHTKIDAMQSALDDAVSKAKFLGDELERVTEERNAAGEAAMDALAKLSARDAEVERLRKDVVKEAFMYGFYSPETYNDTVLNDANECWEKAKGFILRTNSQAPNCLKKKR